MDGSKSPSYCGAVLGRDGRLDPGDGDDEDGIDGDGYDGRDEFDKVTFTDEELTELALGAQPFDPFGPDVVPIDPAGTTRPS